MIAIFLVAAVAAAAANPATPVPGEVRTFEDWSVGCDNGLACQAVSQFPADFVAQPGTIILARDAGGDASVSIRARAYESQRPPVALSIDGRRISAVREVGDAVYAPLVDQSGVVVDALLEGRTAALVDASGAVQGRMSLAGLSAALRYIDDRQGRAGGVTALVAKGVVPSAAVAPVGILPVVTAPSTVDNAPSAPAAIVKRLTAAASCEDAVPDSETHRLDRIHVLILVTCWTGAYNTDVLAYVAARADLADGTPARFDYDVSDGPDRHSGRLSGGYWDGDFGRLRALAKGRGLGDCGTATAWAWDGTRFRLTELRSMPACRGAVDWIPLWRATVRP